MTEPTDDELDAVIAEYRTRIYPQDMHPRFERAIMRAAIAKWGTPPAVAGMLEVTEAECEAAVLELEIEDLHTTQQPTQTADSVQEDAARYRFLRDGEWRDTDLEPFIRLQLNTLWDAKIDAARAAQEGKSHG